MQSRMKKTHTLRKRPKSKLNNRKTTQHIWKIILILLFLALFIPVLINEAFKSNWGIEWLQAEWGAGDALSFCGAILAAVATIIGVHLSIEYAQKNYHEDEINKVKPYLALTHYEAQYHKNLFEDLINSQNPSKNNKQKSPDELYKEYKLNKIYIVIQADTINFMNGLTESQKQFLESGGITWESEDSGGALKKCQLKKCQIISTPFEVENVGNGAALNTTICFYRENKERRGASVYTLKCNQSTYFHIFSDVQGAEIYGDYILEIMYNDILGNSYSQKYKIIIQKDSFKIDLTGTPVLIKNND